LFLNNHTFGTNHKLSYLSDINLYLQNIPFLPETNVILRPVDRVLNIHFRSVLGKSEAPVS